MGVTKFILNIKIQGDLAKTMNSLSQESYINKILEQFNMRMCDPTDTPITKCENVKLCPLTLKEKKKRRKCSSFHVQALLGI